MDDFNGDDRAKPVFDGNKAEFDLWWHQIQLYLEASGEEYIDRRKIQLVLSYMVKGYAGEWAVSYFDKMKTLPAAVHHQWGPFEEALLKAFAPLNKVEEAQVEMAKFKQGKMPIEEYLMHWGQLLVVAKCVTECRKHQDGWEREVTRSACADNDGATTVPGREKHGAGKERDRGAGTKYLSSRSLYRIKEKSART